MRQVTGTIVYLGPMSERPRFHANDHSRDNLVLERHQVSIEDMRARAVPPALDREGFALVPHKSAIADFRDAAEIGRIAPGEVTALIQSLNGADAVTMLGPAILRFGERSAEAGKLNNSQPARFSHIDASDARARLTAEQVKPRDIARPIRRFAQFNIWRAISAPPQDIPLAVCDARSVESADLMEADAVFDVAGSPEWSFEGWVVRYNPAHRWRYFSAMSRDEALVFKTNDSDPAEPHCVPHSAFDDPTCPAGVPTRASIEMRGIAYWFGEAT